jgi:hypothetical protein
MSKLWMVKKSSGAGGSVISYGPIRVPDVSDIGEATIIGADDGPTRLSAPRVDASIHVISYVHAKEADLGHIGRRQSPLAEGTDRERETPQSERHNRRPPDGRGVPAGTVARRAARSSRTVDIAADDPGLDQADALCQE